MCGTWSGAASGVERGDGLAHSPDLLRGQLRKHRERENLARQPLGDAEVAGREFLVRLLTMNRNRIMNARLNSARAQKGCSSSRRVVRMTYR